MNRSEPAPMKLYRWLAAFSTEVFILIVIGGAVRNLGAGLSCPDWPLCYGKIIPLFDIRVFAEWFHRLMAAVVSTFTLGIAIIVFAKAEYRRLLRRPMAFAVALLVVQVILGGLTVLQLLKSEIVTLHLTAATLFFGTVLLMTLKTRHPERVGRIYSSQLGRWGLVTTAAIFLQIILGGMVSSHFAGLACPDFPTCLGVWWPGFSGIAGIHFTHRLGALLVFLVIASFALKVLLTRGLPAGLRRTSVAILVLLVIQVALGISNVIFHLPVSVSVAHLAVAEALFALILISTYEIRHLELR